MDDQDAKALKAAFWETTRTVPRRKLVLLVLFYLVIVLVMANLNALVDSCLHPEIPYFDREHLIVGSISGSLTAVLFLVLLLYTHRLETIVRELKTLKGLLPICSNCKKIRGPDGAWQPIDDYVTKRTDAVFTHSICPDCYVKLYGDRQKEGR